jgi:hypothetical protein
MVIKPDAPQHEELSERNGAGFSAFEPYLT